MNVGQRLRGTVDAIRPHGIYIQLDNGLTGVIHNVDQYPLETLVIDARVNVEVTGLDPKTNRIRLSRKNLFEDLFVVSTRDLQVGDEFLGQITSVVKYGVFVRIGAIEGLAHFNDFALEIPVTPDVVMKTLQENQRSAVNVRVRVLNIDPDNRRLQLALLG
jgi:small subunit ribosomal protein S1